MNIDIVAGGRWHAPEIALALRVLGHEPRLLSTDPAIDASNIRRLVHASQRFARRFDLPSASLDAWIGRLFVRRLRADSSVIAWSSFALAAIRSGRPTIVVRGSHHIQTQRDILLALRGDLGDRVPVPSLSSVALERVEYREAMAVTVPTERIARDVRWSQDGCQPVVSPYGFRLSGLESLPVRQERVVGSALFVGEVGYRKGVDRLLAAFGTQGVPVTHFVLVGGCARGFPLKQMPPWWRFLGQQPADRVQMLLASRQVLVCPSREEGMARAGLEAIAAGTPVVATRIAGLGRWLTEGCGVEVSDSASGDEIAEACKFVLEHWYAYSEKCIEVASRWSWVDHVKVMLGGFGL